MNYLLDGDFKQLENQSITEIVIEQLRNDISKYISSYKPSTLIEFEQEIRSLKSYIEIVNNIEYKEDFMSGYLWGCEDIISSLIKGSDDNEKIRLFREDDIFLKIIELLRSGGAHSSNNIANKLNVSKSMISKRFTSGKYKESEAFIVDDYSQRKYYSLSPKGEQLYLTYLSKLIQKQDFENIVGRSYDFFDFQSAIIPSHNILNSLNIKTIDAVKYDKTIMFEKSSNKIDKEDFIYYMNTIIGEYYGLE